MRSLLIRWLINTLALYVAVQVVPGRRLRRRAGGLLLVAALFGLVNATLRPLLTLLTCPLVLVTLGLFLFVINAMMLLFTGWLSRQFDLGLPGERLLAGVLGRAADRPGEPVPVAHGRGEGSAGDAAVAVRRCRAVTPRYRP